MIDRKMQLWNPPSVIRIIGLVVSLAKAVRKSESRESGTENMSPHWRPVREIVFLQLASAVVMTGLIALLFGKLSAQAFSLGAAAGLGGECVAAALALRTARSPLEVLVYLYTSVVTKWMWVVIVLFWAITQWRMPGLALIMGLICTQLAKVAAGIKKKY